MINNVHGNNYIFNFKWVAIAIMFASLTFAATDIYVACEETKQITITVGQ